MDTLSYRTVSVSKEKAEHKWYIIDAENQITGRMCAEIASILRGKNKPSYTPHADTGDYVIVINAEKIRFTGKKWALKEYKHHSHHPGGLKVVVADVMRTKFPERIVEIGVKGMLPKNRLGSKLYGNLYVYEGSEHPHAAQQPKAITL
jgi:large subunit ribosomal protein L13